MTKGGVTRTSYVTRVTIGHAKVLLGSQSHPQFEDGSVYSQPSPTTVSYPPSYPSPPIHSCLIHDSSCTVGGFAMRSKPCHPL